MMLTNDKIVVKDTICKTFYNNLMKLKEYYKSLNIGPVYFNLDCEFGKTKTSFI